MLIVPASVRISIIAARIGTSHVAWSHVAKADLTTGPVAAAAAFSQPLQFTQCPTHILHQLHAASHLLMLLLLP
jgi:hypothetical protein